jgi:8-oxo-dGTP diphosphatase
LKQVSDINWTEWIPQQRATLLFVIEGDRILLIHKKRGLGAGKINGPGGRLEPGETPLVAAIREVQEELCITPRHIEKSGELFFQFLDGLSIHCTVFRAAAHDGEPQETEEAIPLWVPTDGIPYERMWADDRLWIPLMLTRTPFTGYFLFDAERMLDHRLETSAMAESA